MMKIDGKSLVYRTNYMLNRLFSPTFVFAIFNLVWVLQFVEIMVPSLRAVILDINSVIMFSFLVTALFSCVIRFMNASLGSKNIPFLRSEIPLAWLLGEKVYIAIFYLVYITWMPMFILSGRLLLHPDPDRGLSPEHRSIYIGIMLVLMVICGGIVVFRAAVYLSAKSRMRENG